METKTPVIQPATTGSHINFPVVQSLLTNQSIRIFRSDDETGAELLGNEQI